MSLAKSDASSAKVKAGSPELPSSSCKEQSKKSTSSTGNSKTEMTKSVSMITLHSAAVVEAHHSTSNLGGKPGNQDKSFVNTVDVKGKDAAQN